MSTDPSYSPDQSAHTATPEATSQADSDPRAAATADAPGAETAFDLSAAQARIADLERESAELRDRWMRAEAENANVRARAKREVDETRQYAVQKFATDVVEAAENLRRALASLPPPEPGEPAIVARLREGLEGIERSFLGTLERNGIRREDPTGALFDPNLHQAMGEQVSDDHPPGTVLQAWTSGWTLNGRLLRPAMVVVAKAPAQELPRPANESRADASPAAGVTA